MFGRNVRLTAALILLSLFSTPAQAKKQNFISGFPFGVGFAGGAEERPHSSFAAGSQTTASYYSNYFAFQPFWDMVNISFRLTIGWHFYPLLHGAGSNSVGAFTESSDGGSFDYGARVLLAPFLNQSLDRRGYIVVGVGQSTVKLKNTRKYTTGSLAGQSLTERLQGSGTELNGGIGFEFFLLQNYSFQLEAGYTTRAVEAFGYKSTTDLSNATRTDGEEALNADGTKRGFHVWSPYAQIVLNLNL